MEEDEIMAEICSVFAVAMGNDPNFPFVLLQRCGPGSNTLTAPSLSISFSWTAKEVVRLAGQGCLYIKAEKDLVIVKPESVPEVRNKYTCRCGMGIGVSMLGYTCTTVAMSHKSLNVSPHPSTCITP